MNKIFYHFNKYFLNKFAFKNYIDKTKYINLTHVRTKIIVNYNFTFYSIILFLL